jgi:peptidoglycan LD-endopeptidase CwlK
MEPVLDSLVDGFQQKVIQLIQNCEQGGIIMQPYFTLRDPFKQAEFWRQSRTTFEIQKKIEELKQSGAFFLAHCIESVGKKYGEHVTNAIPGLSWHQWGEAVDSVWVVNKKSEWSTQITIKGLNGYMVYADEAKKLGLDSGFFWTKFKDSPHVQFRKAPSPLVELTLIQIDAEMEKRFKRA